MKNNNLVETTIKFLIENNINKDLMYIDEWKDKELDNYLNSFDKYMQKIDELDSWCKQKNKEMGTNKYKLDTLESYRQIPSIFKQFRFNKNKLDFKELAIKEINRHFKQLQQKVEKQIGKIIKIKPISDNGYDYKFIGENGHCIIEVILAGGYNIQRLHTRWIIKK